MVISNIKRVEILGTRGLSNSNGLIAYNTKTFTNKQSLELLGISEGVAQFLMTPPTNDTVERITSLLLHHEEFSIIKISEGGVFKFNNIRSDAVSGHGFDTMIFLEGDEILGYISLTSPESSNITTKYSKLVRLKRNYTVSSIDVYLDSKENVVRVDKDTISLLNTINDSSTTRDWSKVFLDDKSRIKSYPNYSSKLSSLYKSQYTKNTYTDSIFFHVKEGEGLVRASMNLTKDINLGNQYASFLGSQISFYLGQPALYLWNDNGDYVIFSLQKKLSDVFPGLIDDRPLPITMPKEGVSDSEIYHTEDEIDYFSGQYLVTKKNEIFDIENNIWIKREDGKGRLNTFMTDSQDYKGRLVKLSTSSWANFETAVRDYPFFSDSHANVSELLLEGDIPYRKIGDWLVFKNEKTGLVTYTNFTRTIRFRTSEEQPLILNSQVLVGKEGTKYTFYRNNGYYLSRAARIILGDNYSDAVSHWNPYKDIKEFTDISTFNSSMDLMSCPFNVFRKSYGPDCIENDFNIIGSLCGVIYYRQGTIINYL